MKKLAMLAVVAAATCLSSYGQGYFIFTDSASTAVYDVYTSGHTAPGTFQKSPANVFVAIMYSTNTSAVPLTGTSSSSTNGSQSVTWEQVINDPNFQVAKQTGTNLVAPTRTGISLGTFNGGTVGIDGTAAGQVVKMYVVGWASADGVGGLGSSIAVGWSNPFLMTLGSSGTPGPNLPTAGMTAFGVSPVPEPSTFALAGLGAAAMLIFRRRK